MSCLVLNKWENKFKESLSDYESLDTKEIIFYGVLSKSILKLYREIEPNLTIQFYQKVSTFFSVNLKIFVLIFNLY